jgi:hypothetical protein
MISSILNGCKLLGKDKNLCKTKFFSKRKMYPAVKQRQCNILSPIEVAFHHKLLANLHHSKIRKNFKSFGHWGKLYALVLSSIDHFERLPISQK